MSTTSGVSFLPSSPQLGSLAQSVRTLGTRVAQPLVTARLSQTPLKPLRFPVSPLIPSILIGSVFLYQKGMQKAQPNRTDQLPVQRMLVESGLGYLMATLSNGVIPVLYGIGLSAYRAGQQNNTLDKIHAVVNTAVTLSLGYLGVFLFSGLSEAQHRAENQAISTSLRNPEMRAWLAQLGSHQDKTVREFANTLQELGEKLDIHERLIAENPQTNWEQVKWLRQELTELKAIAATQLQELEEKLPQPSSEKMLMAYSGFRQALGKSQDLVVKFARATNPLAGYFIVGLMLGASVAKDINAFIDRRFLHLRQKNIFSKGISPDNTLIPREFSFKPILPAVGGTSSSASGLSA
jgi:hypothetical protein